jgi:hypothetical protein
MTPALNPRESRRLLRAAALSVHHHRSLRLHHAAVVKRVHSGHHGGADSAATPTSTSFHTVAQFNNASSSATAAIADHDLWAVGSSISSQQPLAAHFNGTSWSVVSTPVVQGGVFNDVSAAASNDVWAVGYQTSGSSISTLIEHWNGTSWSIVDTLSGFGATGVTALSDGTVVVVGENGGILQI